LAATWRWPTLAQMNHSELSHMAGAVDDSTINIVEVIIIIITVHRRLRDAFFSLNAVTTKRHYRPYGITVTFSPGPR